MGSFLRPAPYSASAVRFPRQQRGERLTRSRLSDIPGLGPKRIKELLAHFRSIDAIQLANMDNLAAAPGMGPALARQVWEYFHPADGLPGEGGLPGENGPDPLPMELAS